MTQLPCPAPSIQLSASERQVLALIAQGQSNTEIASVMDLSPHPIKTHVRGIFNKFGVENRVQAVVFALRHGVL